ncbi:hypothetical protein [Kineosporia babensis]|uniref:Uncharacterized protein n=1 Tax=Kineosporia babensis TaxID=499548 RepID=A0A9X1NCU8_9ACTN|nr:hypothetical protein [Kineosporia babensis]MCD5311768.1 hypothetical protein [Kineosporia babensis]
MGRYGNEVAGPATPLKNADDPGILPARIGNIDESHALRPRLGIVTGLAPTTLVAG